MLTIALSQACTLKQVIYPNGAATATILKPDFTKYIAIGDSQTAGYANDGLYNDGINASFPNTIASQLKATGGGTFSQPLFSAAQANGSGYLKLTGYNADGTPITTRVTDQLAVRSTNPTLYTKYIGSNNNLAVTGIAVANIADGNYGNTNPYFERLLTAVPPNNTTAYQDYVMANTFTFFTCWLGNNDVLGYAISGGSTALPTDQGTFSQLYTAFINKLTANKQMGALANVPDVSVIPYFNTVTVSTVNATIQKANPAAGLYISARSTSDVTNSTYTTRLATVNDLLILTFSPGKIGQLVSTSSGMQPYGLSPLAPVESSNVLDQNEISIVRSYTAAYNSTIKQIATAKGLALFDANSYLAQIKAGLVLNGISVNSTYITGGVFSLDGVHLTPRGYAMEANEFIKAINAQYATTIKTVDISAYAGVLP